MFRSTSRGNGQQHWSASLTAWQIKETDNGDRVLLPPSALEQLVNTSALPDERNPRSFGSNESGGNDKEQNTAATFSQSSSPLTFQLRNEMTGRVTHAGVREFSAEEGTVRLPAWMFRSLALTEGESVLIRAVKLPKGTWAQLQPLNARYLDIRDYR
jgi:hypothetical protein